jgi:hypothetical protein
MLIIFYVYELWRVLAGTSLYKSWLWKIREHFPSERGQAIAYILCRGSLFLRSVRFTYLLS